MTTGGIEHDMERVVGSLAGVSGHTFDAIYDLLFTTERVIAVIIQHPTDIPYRPKVTELFIGRGRAMRGEQLERQQIAESRRRALKERTPDVLVALHPLNFGIYYSVITSAEVKRGRFQSHLEFHVYEASTVGRRVRFAITKKQIPDAERLLDLVLPTKSKGT
ncbi:hypothetical protein ACFLXE_08650 [Chloroflexota bacterium]